jgi:hypothetical protein
MGIGTGTSVFKEFLPPVPAQEPTHHPLRSPIPIDRSVEINYALPEPNRRSTWQSLRLFYTYVQYRLCALLVGESRSDPLITFYLS